MKKLSISCLLLFYSCLLLAQEQPKIIGYFDINWKETKNEKEAVYYRTVKVGPDGNDLFVDSEILNSKAIASFYYDSIVSDTVYIMVEIPAEYNKGLERMFQTINKTMKYPAEAHRSGIQGTVYVGFIVDKNGKPINPYIIKGVSKDCDEEAIRVVTLLRDWKPGVHHGKPVNVKYVLPIKYKLG